MKKKLSPIMLFFMIFTLAGSVEAITEELPENCSISDNVLGVYRPEVAESKDRVLTWLEEIETELA